MTCAYSLPSLGLDGICKRRTFRALTSPNWLQMFHHVHRKHPAKQVKRISREDYLF